MEAREPDAGSTIPRRQLGRHLRQLRTEAQVTVRDAAAAMEWSEQTIWRVETGKGPVRSMDVKAMCDLCGADGQTTEALAALAKETRAKGWWHAYGRTLPSWFELYVGLESAASRIRWYESERVPGILQTRRYAEETFRAAQPLPEEDLARRVEVRLARQQLLTRRLPAPPQLDVIVGEAALLRSTAERTAMTEQLEQLLRLARLPNLSLRVLPLAASLRCAPDAMFEILEFPKSRTGQAEPPVVYSDSLTGAIYLDHPDEVAAYDEVWRRTTEAALTGDDSDKFITSMIERYRDA